MKPKINSEGHMDILVRVPHQFLAIEQVRNERDRQDKKWGEYRILTNEKWLTILTEEFGEVANAMLERTDNLEEEITQVAAVAVAWLESRLYKRHMESRKGQ